MVKYLAQTRGDLAALRGTHRIGWENNKQTKLKMEPRPKTKELQPIGVQLNQRFYCRQANVCAAYQQIYTEYRNIIITCLQNDTKILIALLSLISQSLNLNQLGHCLSLAQSALFLTCSHWLHIYFEAYHLLCLIVVLQGNVSPCVVCKVACDHLCAIQSTMNFSTTHGQVYP